MLADEAVPVVAFMFKQRLFDTLHDVVTIAASVVDVVADILVTIEFYNGGPASHHFFLASCGIFIAAQVVGSPCTALPVTLLQLCYAFLFVYTHAQHRGAPARVLTFLLVLPLAQLVPIFTWIESVNPRLGSILTGLLFGLG